MRKFLTFLRNNDNWVVFTLCILFLVFLSVIVTNEGTVSFDEKCYSIVSNTVSLEKSYMLKNITFLASKYWLIGFSIFLILVLKNKKMGLIIFINLALSSLVNSIYKILIRRPRPVGLNLIEETGYSFPSGHSMVSMAFYGFLIYLVFKNVKNVYLKTGLIALMSMLILGVGFSRIYLGVHFTSDVIAGFTLGLAYLVVFISVWTNGISLKNRKAET